jgi:hypothetical protein
MKRKLLVLTFLIIASSLAKAQISRPDSAVLKRKKFVAKIQTVQNVNDGFLAGIDDTTINLSPEPVTFRNSITDKPGNQSYYYSEIKNVRIRKYGSITRGILIGGSVGAAFGSLLQAVASNSLTFGSYDGGYATSDGSGHLLTGLITGLITGALIGEFAGSKMRKFNIRRNKEKFRDMRSAILEMSLRDSHQDSSATNDSFSSFY